MKILSKKSFTLFLCFLFSSYSWCSAAPLKVATYANSVFSYDFTSAQITSAFDDAKQQKSKEILELGLEGDLASFKVNDPDPTNSQSVPYWVYVISNKNTNETKQWGHKLTKVINGSSVDYYVDLDNLNNDNDATAARSWKCTTSSCGGCDPHRTGFLGLGGVDRCDCTGASGGNCNFEGTGGGFPWPAVIGLLGVLIGILAN